MVLKMAAVVCPLAFAAVIQATWFSPLPPSSSLPLIPTFGSLYVILSAQLVGDNDDRDYLFEAGRLVIEVIEARNLCNRANEPYCIAAYEHNQMLLPVAKGKNPQWRTTAILYVRVYAFLLSPCVCVRLYLCLRVSVRVCAYMCAYARVCVCVCVCVCIATYEHNQMPLPVAKGRNPQWRTTAILYVVHLWSVTSRASVKEKSHAPRVPRLSP